MTENETLTELLARWKEIRKGYTQIAGSTIDPERRKMVLIMDGQLAICIAELEALIFKNSHAMAIAMRIVNANS